MATDRDGDGIPDCRERAGLYPADGDDISKTDPEDPDTDGDGVSDGDEVRWTWQPIDGGDLPDLWGCRSVEIAALSDPTVADSDMDGLGDAIELSEGTDPFVADADDDGLSDADEREWGSDPFTADTDGDGFDDGSDVTAGLNPVVVDEGIDDEQWYSEYAEGIGLGAFDEIDSVPQLLGALSPSVAGSVPILGWAFSALADLRDAIAEIVDGDWAAALASAAAVLPYAGDSAKASILVSKFAARHPERVRQLIQGILSLEKMPFQVRAALLRNADPAGVYGLRSLDLSDEIIVKFAERGTSLAQVVKAADLAVRLVMLIPDKHADVDGFVVGLEDAQEALRIHAAEVDDTAEVANGAVYVSGSTDQALTGGRLIDACSECDPFPRPDISVLRIAKLASLHMSRTVEQQIDKDAYLLDMGYALEWHFFAGPTGWTVDPAVLEGLDNAGIPYVMHLPA